MHGQQLCMLVGHELSDSNASRQVCAIWSREGSKQDKSSWLVRPAQFCGSLSLASFLVMTHGGVVYLHEELERSVR